MKHCVHCVLALVLFMLFSSISIAQNFWQQTNGPYGGYVGALSVSSTGGGIVTSGYGGYFTTHYGYGAGDGAYLSIDYGSNWIPLRYFYQGGDPSTDVLMATSGSIFVGSRGQLGNTFGSIYRYNSQGTIVNTVLSINHFSFTTIYESPSGELFAAGDSIGISGIIYRSTNNGNSWTRMGLVGYRALDLLKLPNGHLLSACESFIFGSELVRRSTDNGLTWGSSGTGLTSIENVLLLKLKSNGDVLAGTTSGIFLSSNNGSTWSLFSLDSAEVSSIEFKSATELYAGVSHYHPSYSGTRTNVYRSTDGGTSWTQRGFGSAYPFVFSVAVKTDGHIYAGNGDGLFLSIDDGLHWSRIGPPGGDSGLLTIGEDYPLAVSPSGILFTRSNSLELSRSFDGGKSWKSSEIDSSFLLQIVIRQFVFPSDSTILAAVDPLHLYRSTNNGETWTNVGGFTTISGMTTYHGIIYITVDEGLVYRSTDDGLNWTEILESENGAITIAADSLGDIFFSTYDGSIFRSTDNGTTWGEVFADTVYGGGIWGFCVNPKGDVFAGSNGIVFRSTDNGAHWVNLPFPEGGEIYSLVTDAAGNLFATNNGNVFRSMDNGNSWENVTSNLPPGQLNNLAMSQDGRLYAGTGDNGVFRSAQKTYKPFIDGKVFYDYANSCDKNQPGRGTWTVKLNTKQQITDDDGYYRFPDLTSGTYTLTEVLKANYEQTCPPCPICPVYPVPITFTIDSAHSHYTVNYGIKPLTNINDLAVTVAGGIARPGRKETFGIRYENKGTNPQTATVTFNYPTQATYIPGETNPPPTVIDTINGRLRWTFANLPSATVGWISANVQLAPPPLVTIGTVLASNANIGPTPMDVNTYDNTDHEYETARSSFDPNEMSVTPPGTLPYGGINVTDTLRYHIDFQNTGNDTAFTVVVQDTLDSNLDYATFEEGASSHAYSLQFIDGNIAQWTFDNILLPDSNINEEGSHGFVEFRILPRADAVNGTDIRNRAGIYFDFNPGVTTNTVSNRIGQSVELAVSVSDKWNMLSVPVIPVNDSVKVLFPMATSNAFGYTGSSYIIKNTLSHGSGYWLKFGSSQNTSLTGAGVTSDSISVVSGWNLVGSVVNPTTTSSVTAVGTSITSSFFGYSGAYARVDTIKPGKGYWVKTAGAGHIVLSSGSNAQPKPVSEHEVSSLLSTLSSIIIEDAAGNTQTLYIGTCEPYEGSEPSQGLAQFEMPPVPPSGIFDARFASQRFAEVYPPKLEKTQHYRIDINSAVYPVTIRWTIVAGTKERYFASTILNGTNQKSVILKQGGSIRIANPDVTSLMLNVENGRTIPAAYALHQNYPNPFNPSTMLEYDLPKNSRVTLKIYDILGQEVATLVNNEDEEAGMYQVEFRGDNVASGVYVYRLEATNVETKQGFTQVKKMLMIR